MGMGVGPFVQARSATASSRTETIDFMSPPMSFIAWVTWTSQVCKREMNEEI